MRHLESIHGKTRVASLLISFRFDFHRSNRQVVSRSLLSFDRNTATQLLISLKLDGLLAFCALLKELISILSPGNIMIHENSTNISCCDLDLDKQIMIKIVYFSIQDF